MSGLGEVGGRSAGVGAQLQLSKWGGGVQGNQEPQPAGELLGELQLLGGGVERGKQALPGRWVL
jgi:hypothetical protein